MSISPTNNSTARHGSGSVFPATHKEIQPAVSPLLLPSAVADLKAGEPRRSSSIQFKAHTNIQLPRGSPKQRKDGLKRRISSPPPPPAFQPRVSFDTFDRPADFIEENSFTLITKHKDYEYTKRSRTFLCGYDDNEYSDYALQWLIDELVDDGDEIVCLRVVEKDDTIAGGSSVEKGQYKEEAEGVVKRIQVKNHENKAINLILEFAIGKVNKVIDEMINLYEPAILVVGTRGRSLGGFQGLLPGSVSKYCLQHSPVPVIVVRPSSKRDKARVKRAQDPSRHGYADIIAKSGTSDPYSFMGMDTKATDEAPNDEAAAVANAIGYHPAMGLRLKSEVEKEQEMARRRKRFSTGAPVEKEDEDKARLGVDDLNLKSPGVVMKSPELGVLDSPTISDVSSNSSEEEEQEQGKVSTITVNDGEANPATTEGTTDPASSGSESVKGVEEAKPNEQKSTVT